MLDLSRFAMNTNALAGTLEVLTKRLSYAKAEELVALITKSALSARGTVQVDPRTNTLILTDLPDRLTLASDLIGTLDQPQPQVEIEARIVQISRYPAVGQEVHHKPAGSVSTVEFELEGQRYLALNGGPEFKFNEAISLMIMCETQADIDYYWDKLTPGSRT